MTQDEIIEMARQSGVRDSLEYDHMECDAKSLEAFANLIHTRGWMQGYTSCDNDNKNLDSALIDDAVEEEREACAKLIAKLTEMLEIQQKLHETAIDMLKPAIEAEREACAKVCDVIAQKMDDEGEGPTGNIGWVIDCAEAIRARGQA